MLLSYPDVGIIGAGPAGSTCAALLADGGYSVALVDQDTFPRDKPCGDGVTPKAVTILKQLGLTGLIEEAHRIAGCRVVLDHRREHLARFATGTYGLCVRRSQLDEALLQTALARGAQFVRARAHGIAETDACSLSILLDGDSGPSRLTAKRVVASDGATSAIRRSAGLGTPGHSVRAWGIRGYYVTERPLDPLFDIYLPLEIEGKPLLGYGWVFPISEYTANIGVGYFRSTGVGHLPRLNTALAAFIDELRLRAGRRFGDIEACGRPIGSPIALNFVPSSCHSKNLLLAGDAAGLTDPFTGEGIGPAMEAGVIAADSVANSLKHGTSLTTYIRDLGRCMPRAGQDFSVIARVAAREKVIDGLSEADIRQLDFVSSIFALASDRDPAPVDSDVTPLLEASAAGSTMEPDELSDRLLEAGKCSFPLTTPVIARTLHAHGGAIYATALVLAVRATGSTARESILLGSQAAEYLAIFPDLLSGLCQYPVNDAQKLNNALAILSADFSVTRSILAVADISPRAVTALARAARRVCEGGMMDAGDRYDLNRQPERYLAAVEHRIGSLLGFAVELGAELGGAPREARVHVYRYGLELGVAYELSNDLDTLRQAHEGETRAVIAALRGGRYSLPMLLSFARDTRLRQEVVAAAFDRGGPQIVRQIQATNASTEVREVASKHLARAREELAAASLNDPSGLITLVEWVARRLSGSAANA